MTNANNLSEKLKFRKIGHMVFVAGSIRFSDNGKFANDQALGSVPSGMTPNGYDEFECLIPIAMHNGGPAGTQARIYIKNGGVYIVGTDEESMKAFMNSVIDHIVVLNRQITEIVFKNGLSHKLLYR